MRDCIYNRPIEGQPSCVTLWKECDDSPQKPCEHFAPMTLPKVKK